MLRTSLVPPRRAGGTDSTNSARRVEGAAAARLDVHNTSVNTYAAEHHLCGTLHLATGRTCLLPERHAGGCAFS
jgi:hypothetical protein